MGLHTLAKIRNAAIRVFVRELRSQNGFQALTYLSLESEFGVIIRILHDCDVLLEKSGPRVIVCHHVAPRVMLNFDPRDRFFLYTK